jgi:serine/threonine protein kinase/tetratricopeptide (TPR) repeat protein
MTQVIAKRYEVQDQLGVGGMGTVYRAYDRQTQHPVAIKLLRAEMTEPDLLERFQREGEALRNLNHPNIVKLLDTIQENDSHYLVMEYLPGGDLNALLKREKLTIEKVLQIAIDLCDALARAHRLEIIHRDLKPANVLLADDGTPRLTDFGIAHIAEKERVTDTNDIVGTIDYVAPEALASNDIDSRADIWAFGVMLFEMLTGERPYKGDTIAKTVTGILKEPVPDIEKMRPDMPVALADLIYRMLEKDRNVRISSVRYVGVELEYILRRYISGVGESDSKKFETIEAEISLHPRHNLPAQTTAFIGREAEITELTRLIDDPSTRLITIVAPGGMGKTRLSLEIASRYIMPTELLVNGNGIKAQHTAPLQSNGHEHVFKNGVYFVELAPLNEPAAIVPAIADAVGYKFQSSGQEPKQQLIAFLRPKNMLLVLDNFEHLIQEAGLTTELLQEAPQLQILVTSRQRLNQTGETVFNLQGMDFPQWKTPDDVMNYGAVQFFVQSAKRVQPDFKLTADNLEAVTRICHLVQGLPLGILLATSWLSLLSPHEIAREIAQSLDFLETTIGDLPERHRSIRAVFDYSWNLMSSTEQQVFMKLAVFRGGFSRMAAAAVADANLRTLMSLITKSLIHRDADSGRYHVHELLRQYGEALLKQNQEYEATVKAHASYYLTMLTHFWSGSTFQSPEVVDEIALDYDNIRMALQWAAQYRLLDDLRGAIEPLFYYYDLRGLHQEGVVQYRKLLDTLQAQPAQLTDEWEALLLAFIAKLFASYDVEQTRTVCQTALAKIKVMDASYVGNRLYSALGHAAWVFNDYELSLKHYRQALLLAEIGTNPYDIALAQHNIAYLLHDLKRYDEAVRYSQQALAHFDRYETHMRRSDIHLLLGNLAQVRDDEKTAISHFSTALEDSKRWKTLFVISMCVQSLIYMHMKRGESEQVRAVVRDGLVAHEHFGQQWQILGFLLGTARICYDYIGGRERAIELLALVQHHPETASFAYRPVQETLELHKQHVTAEAYQAAYERGKDMDLAEAVKALLADLAE